MAALQTIDHAVIAVRDLDAASAVYTALLGRRASWRGNHPGMGTANVLFRLDNTYLELLGPSGPGWLGDALRQHLDSAGEGPFALAFGTADIHAAVSSLRAAELRFGDSVDGEGRDGDRRRTWKISAIPATDTRGLNLFIVQHLTAPDALPFAEPAADQASAVAGVDHFVIMTSDPDGARGFYGDKLELRLALDRDFPERGVRLLFFRIGGITLECAAPSVADPSGAGSDQFWGISYRVPDIERARDRVAAAGIDVSEVRKGQRPGTRVCTVRDRTHGVATLFIAHESQP
jgi:catechol 2,3-dioxygenase-like lactoylglutathione lyase family enzyme